MLARPPEADKPWSPLAPPEAGKPLAGWMLDGGFRVSGVRIQETGFMEFGMYMRRKLKVQS
ncbi:hypothetical protein D3OALGA1CA_5199 [Olavius algarvensis associated proteobacterium Delta 3]|nr:hypothetical protein D3OALGB2SA_2695 [Olavius algarvensis associated proteobacterium Delta 3]CAB5163297.1 hypothetical protein D3OALGA1CA_5199 [Olavius algarvensis associated proteobacterium Delta 3]